MNSNIRETDNNIMQICQAISEMKTSEEVYNFLFEVLTDAEIDALSKRWRILNLLHNGVTQREIAKELHVSLCKITRGAAILRNKNAITNKILIKERK
ncbi:helix-turn-helix domain-containing protein [bacterium]|nr:helix-turn-helix domain-containing protein [bacterium]